MRYNNWPLVSEATTIFTEHTQLPFILTLCNCCINEQVEQFEHNPRSAANRNLHPTFLSWRSLIIDLMLHISFENQTCCQAIHLTRELKLCYQILCVGLRDIPRWELIADAEIRIVTSQSFFTEFGPFHGSTRSCPIQITRNVLLIF